MKSTFQPVAGSTALKRPLNSTARTGAGIAIESGDAKRVAKPLQHRLECFHYEVHVLCRARLAGFREGGMGR